MTGNPQASARAPTVLLTVTPPAVRPGVSTPAGEASRHIQSTDDRDGVSRNAESATFLRSSPSYRAHPRSPAGESCPAPRAGRTREAARGPARDNRLDLAAAQNGR